MTRKSSLETYRHKRDFRKTSEPSGERGAPQRRRPIFVVQEHDATRLHYDFRLEVDGVLKSWAVPKGPSLDPAERRLAVRTEDHPLDYAGFEGVIPAGEYGAGPVIVWDAGYYDNLKRDRNGREVPMARCVEDGRVEIALEGRKLTGGFALVRTRLDPAKTRENWLLIKMRDTSAAAGADPKVAHPESVISGRTIAEMDGKAPRARRAPAARKAVAAKKRPAARRTASRPGGRAARRAE